MFLLSGAIGCHDQGEGVLGEACEGDGECRSGFCWAGCRDPGADDDGDGLANLRERELGLSAIHADSDGDGILDSDELGDHDGDGRLDALESRVGDDDGDCLPDELDPSDEAVPLEELARHCRQDGVCAGAGVTARCEGRLVCDYGAVSGFEVDETRCDGLDNDCDGRTDEGLVYVESTGMLKVLGDGCVGRGECAAEVGVVECSALGTVVCSVDRSGSENAGASEDLDCDGLDNDCDGEVDEGVSWLEPDTGQVRRYGAACRARGVCGLAAGVVECSVAGRGICSTEPGGSADKSGPERCDGLDEDCDGRVDEGVTYNEGGVRLSVGQPCGRGICQGTTVSCAGGVAVCPGLERLSDEVCNDLDDDCDGEVDEAADVVRGCPSLGDCEGRDLVASCEGGLVCRYRDDEGLFEPPSFESRCDGRDEDCDGATDEDLEAADGGKKGEACLGSGLCATVQGFYICAVGGLVCSADAGLAEVCDGVDNDCDGVTDEDLIEVAACAGPGVCAEASPFASCQEGVWVCPHETLPDYREEELADLDCDGLDNDCDGLVDEGSRRQPTGTLEFLTQAPPPRLAAAMGSGGGSLWVHGGLDHPPRSRPNAWESQTGAPEVRGGLWRFRQAIEGDSDHGLAGSWDYVSMGPIRGGHAMAADTQHVFVHGGFEVADREVPGLGPDGEAVSSMWAFDVTTGTWTEVIQYVTGFENELSRMVGRTHHTLTALAANLLVLHGGHASDDAAEALLGRVGVEGGVLVCRWTPIPGPGWRVGHSAIGMKVAGEDWVVLAGGLTAGTQAAQGWAAFSLDGRVALAANGGPVLSVKPGLVALMGAVVALGGESHRLDLQVGSGRVNLFDTALDLGLQAPVVAGQVPVSGSAGGSAGLSEGLGLSLASGDAVGVAVADNTLVLSRRLDLVRPAPRVGGALLLGDGVARPSVLAETAALWLMGGHDKAGEPLSDLWAWPLPSGPWVKVAGVSGRGGDSVFTALDGVLWAASPAAPGVGVELARFETGTVNTWQDVATTGGGPLTVAAMEALEVDGLTSLFVVSEVSGGLTIHEARVGETVVWSPLGEWQGALGPVVMGPLDGEALTLMARVGDTMVQRRLTRTGLGEPVQLVGEAPTAGRAAWDRARSLGYVVDSHRVWVLDPAVGIGSTAVEGLWPGAVTYAPDGALWVFGANLARVPFKCAGP